MIINNIMTSVRENMIVLTDTEKPNINSITGNALEIVKTKVRGIKIRPSTLHLIIKYVMETVEETPIKGSEQKEMALKLIRVLAVDLTEGEDEKVIVGLLDDGTIGNMIDLIVDATRGKLDVNRTIEVAVAGANRCIPYLCG